MTWKRGETRPGARIAAYSSPTAHANAYNSVGISPVEGNADEEQLELLDAVAEIDEDSNLCSFCGHVTRFDDTACKGCGQLTEHGEFVAGGGNAAVQTEAVG